MDIMTFISTRNRMCNSYDSNCKGCPINFESSCCTCSSYIWEKPTKAVEIIEQWDKEHPVITKEIKFAGFFGVEFGDATNTAPK